MLCENITLFWGSGPGCKVKRDVFMKMIMRFCMIDEISNYEEKQNAFCIAIVRWPKWLTFHFHTTSQFRIPNSEIRSANFGIRNSEFGIVK